MFSHCLILHSLRFLSWYTSSTLLHTHWKTIHCQVKNKTNMADKCKKHVQDKQRWMFLFLKSSSLVHRQQKLLLQYSMVMVNGMCQCFFAQMNSAKEFCVGVIWFAGCHASCWSRCCGSRAFPGDLAGISEPDRSIGGKLSAYRLLLMMSSVLICL